MSSTKYCFRITEKNDPSKVIFDSFSIGMYANTDLRSRNLANNKVSHLKLHPLRVTIEVYPVDADLVRANKPVKPSYEDSHADEMIDRWNSQY